MRHLICYDIACDRRRRRVVRLLEGYGHRLHESAFLARLRPAQLSRLQRKLPQLIDDAFDKVTVYPLCERDHPDAVHLGLSKPPDNAHAVIV